jgi:hypothetical protein
MSRWLQREKEAAKARLELGDDRLLRFLQATLDPRFASKVMRWGVSGCEHIKEELAKGKGLDEIFYTGDKYGFILDAKRLGDRKYRVEFGCEAGPLAGDGAVWLVTPIVA